MTTIQTSSPALHGVPTGGPSAGALVAAGEDKTSTGITVLPVPVMPVDPESLDATRPDDIDACSVCEGLGGIQVPIRTDRGIGYDVDACWSCGGTGTRGAA